MLTPRSSDTSAMPITPHSSPRSPHTVPGRSRPGKILQDLGIPVGLVLFFVRNPHKRGLVRFLFRRHLHFFLQEALSACHEYVKNDFTKVYASLQGVRENSLNSNKLIHLPTMLDCGYPF